MRRTCLNLTTNLLCVVGVGAHMERDVIVDAYELADGAGLTQTPESCRERKLVNHSCCDGAMRPLCAAMHTSMPAANEGDEW